MDSSDGGRKWALAKGIFWSANALAAFATVVTLVRSGDLMDVLQWWGYMMGALLTLYGGMNVVQKGVTK